MKQVTFIKLMRDCGVVGNKLLGSIKENGLNIIVSGELSGSKSNHLSFNQFLNAITQIIKSKNAFNFNDNPKEAIK